MSFYILNELCKTLSISSHKINEICYFICLKCYNFSYEPCLRYEPGIRKKVETILSHYLSWLVTNILCLLKLVAGISHI